MLRYTCDFDDIYEVIRFLEYVNDYNDNMSCCTYIDIDVLTIIKDGVNTPDVNGTFIFESSNMPEDIFKIVNKSQRGYRCDMIVNTIKLLGIFPDEKNEF